MNVQEEKRKCCGCSACVNICPKNCIAMKEDEYGFLYPVIDESQCIQCNLCKKVCAFNRSEKRDEGQYPIVFAAKNIDKNIHEKSSSGGIFIPLSDFILNNDGVIYGVEYDEDFTVKHGRANNKESRDRFVGSKYIQSDMKRTFMEVKRDLKDGKYVLFSGTACQVHGLVSYLESVKCNTDKLYTVDIVCHGVPSPKMWKEFLKKFEKIGQIESITFTSKKIKNELKGLRCKFKNGKEILTGFYWTSYGKLFLNNYILRESCYNCPYTSVTNRYADITIGDYWGLEKSMPEFCHKKGVSLVLLHSKKGKELFDGICEQIEYRKSDVENCIQPNLKEPSKKPIKLEKFQMKYKKFGYQRAYNYLFPETIKGKIGKIKRKITGNILGKDF